MADHLEQLDLDMHSSTAPLFSPLKLRDVTLRNRIGVSPMCQYSSDDGFASDWHLVHLGSRAVGGAGLVFTEATAVTANGRISPNDLGIYRDEHGEMLSRTASLIQQHGAIAGIQLAHAGRKASCRRPWDGGGPATPAEGGWDDIVAPSAVPFDSASPQPSELDQSGIDAIVTAFTIAAKRALECDFKVVEVHAAHGYLLHEFLSPLSNLRTDDYGGSFDNRIRLVCDVIRAVRTVWPERLPLFLRVSSTDWTDGGWTVDDTVALARRVFPLGVDVIDCSSGGNVASARLPIGPGYQTAFAQRVRSEANGMSAAVGMITSPAQADHIIRTGQADMVLLAREMLRDPYFPLHAARALGVELEWPVQYKLARS